MCAEKTKVLQKDGLKNVHKVQKLYKKFELDQRRKVCKNKDIKSKGEKFKKCKLKHNDISDFKDEKYKKWFDTNYNFSNVFCYICTHAIVCNRQLEGFVPSYRKPAYVCRNLISHDCKACMCFKCKMNLILSSTTNTGRESRSTRSKYKWN